MGHRAQVAAALIKARAVEFFNLAPWAAVISIWALVLLHGGEAPAEALPIAFAQVCLLVGWAWADPKALAPTAFRRACRVPALLAALLAGWLFLQLFVFGSGMAEDAWRLVGHAPRATLDVYASLAEMAKLCGFGALCIIGVRIGADARLRRGCWLALALGGVLYFGGIIFAELSVSSGAPDASRRLTGTFHGPNPNAALAGLMAVVAWRRLWLDLPALFGDRSRTRAAVLRVALPAILAALSLTALVMSGSRGGVIASLVGLACCGLATLRSDRIARNWKPAALMGLLLAAFGLSALFGAGAVADRMLDASSGVADRQGILALYLERLPLLPWSGFGLGTFRHFNNIISSAADAERLWTFGAMHNVYLQWIFEGGYVGAGLMFGVVAALLWNIVSMGGRGPNVWSAAAFGASALILTHGAIDFDLQVPAVAALWALLLGLGLGEGLDAGSRRGVQHEKTERQRTGGIGDVAPQRLDDRLAR
jgi:O-antigen ligase